MKPSHRNGKGVRVCVVSPLYHPSLGGLGRQAQLLTERLAGEGVPVFVIARRMKGMPPADFHPSVKVHRAWSLRPSLHNYEKVTFANILTSLTFSLSCAFLLAVKSREYDIVHFHGASLPLFVNTPLLKLLRKKIIAKVAAANIGTEAGSLRGRYFGFGNALIRLLTLVDGFIAISSEIAEGLKKDGIAQDRIHRITNFIDLSRYAPAGREEKKVLKESLGLGAGPVVTFTGRFDTRKGIQYLLEAWAAVVREVPAARLLLLGDGPLFGQMRDLAAGLGLGGSAVLKGHMGNVVDFLRASDIYVFPSLQEGMPNALLEAMACGLPPVATRIGGVVDVIEHRRNGVLVEPRDAQGLAEGILLLLKNRGEAGRIATAAYERIASSYSLDATVPRYLKIYRELSGPGALRVSSV